MPVGSKPIKYLYKYLTKGPHMTRVHMSGQEDNAGETDQVSVPQDKLLHYRTGTSHETRAEREKRDEPLRYITYRFVSAVEG